MSILQIILLLFRALFRDRSQLALEDLALLQQFAVRKQAVHGTQLGQAMVRTMLSVGAQVIAGPNCRGPDRGTGVHRLRTCESVWMPATPTESYAAIARCQVD